MNGVQYAKFEIKSCPMYDDACAARVAEHVARFLTRNAVGELTVDVPALIEERCGRYARGKHKGALRGWAHIMVCVEGGWRRYGPGERNGGVVYPGTIVNVTISDFNGTPYLEVGA